MIVLKILGYIILAIVLIVVFLFVYTYIDNAAGFKKKREGKWKEKAEKLLGKNLNLRYARQAYYENDNAELAFCINEQIGSYANYIKLSKPQKEALAKAIGMSTSRLIEVMMNYGEFYGPQGTIKDSKESVKFSQWIKTNETLDIAPQTKKLLEDTLGKDDFDAENMLHKSFSGSVTYKLSKSEILDKLNLSLNIDDEYINFSKYILKYKTKDLREIRDKLNQEILENKISVQEVTFYEYDSVFQFRDNIREEIFKILDSNKRIGVWGFNEIDYQQVSYTCFEKNKYGYYPKFIIPKGDGTETMAWMMKFWEDTSNNKKIKPKFKELDLNLPVYEGDLFMLGKQDANDYLIEELDNFIKSSEYDNFSYDEFLNWWRNDIIPDGEYGYDWGPYNDTTFGIKFNKINGGIPKENDLEIEVDNYAIDTGINTKEIISFACNPRDTYYISSNFRIKVRG